MKKDYFICVDIISSFNDRFAYQIVQADLETENIVEIAKRAAANEFPDRDLSSATLKVIAFNPV